jgi:hypothetical protein
VGAVVVCPWKRRPGRCPGSAYRSDIARITQAGVADASWKPLASGGHESGLSNSASATTLGAPPMFTDDFSTGNLSKWTTTSYMSVTNGVAEATSSGTSASYAQKVLSAAGKIQIGETATSGRTYDIQFDDVIAANTYIY